MEVEQKHPGSEVDGLVEPPFGRNGALGFLFGIVIGAAAGLIGVGGGEFRIPVLLHVIRLPVKNAAGANTVIGLVVVVLSVARRWGQQRLSADDLTLGGVMAVVSILGAAIGAMQAHRLPSRLLTRLVCIYLIAVGVWMVIEGIAQAEHTVLEPAGWPRWILAALVGFIVAVVSGGLGVAGGEKRIPALIYLFAVPVKTAGTISLIASIPTVVAGAFTYRQLGHVPDLVLVLSILMGAGSIVGVLIGASVLAIVAPHTIKALLGIILLIATICLMLPSFVSGGGADPPETQR